MKISDITHDIRTCYGALSSFQSQLHHINGVVEEIHGTFQVLLGAFNDLESLLKEISNKFIIEWLNQHPDRKNPNAFLFAHKRKEKVLQYSQRGLQEIIERNNNLSKRIYPHLFRHTAASNDYGNLNEKLMMMKYGWKTRAMIDRYAHLKDFFVICLAHFISTTI